MDKRFFLALFLSLVVIAISQLLFPPTKPTPSSEGAIGKDSISGLKNSASSTQLSTTQSSVVEAPATASSKGRTAKGSAQVRSTPEATAVTTAKAIYKFSNIGAAPVSIVFRDYRNRSAKGGLVDLGISGSPLLSYQLVTPTDTTDLSQVPFALVRVRNTRGDETVTYNASKNNLGISISYTVSQDTTAS